MSDGSGRGRDGRTAGQHVRFHVPDAENHLLDGSRRSAVQVSFRDTRCTYFLFFDLSKGGEENRSKRTGSKIPLTFAHFANILVVLNVFLKPLHNGNGDFKHCPHARATSYYQKSKV